MSGDANQGGFMGRFDLDARGSDVRTEVLAGITTFLVMA
jgi:xanthine/uracil/vitamin C permease (AzgA family)